MKKILFFTFATFLLLAGCSDPELEERNRLIGEWERLDLDDQPNVIITKNQIIIEKDSVFYYNLIEPGKLYLKYTRQDYIPQDNDTIYILQQTVNPYVFLHDSLIIDNIVIPVLDEKYQIYKYYRNRKITLCLKRL